MSPLKVNLSLINVFTVCKQSSYPNIPLVIDNKDKWQWQQKCGGVLVQIQCLKVGLNNSAWVIITLKKKQLTMKNHVKLFHIYPLSLKYWQGETKLDNLKYG